MGEADTHKVRFEETHSVSLQRRPSRPPWGEAYTCVMRGHVQISRMFVAAAICRHGRGGYAGKLRFTVRCFVYGYDGTDVEEAKMTDNYTKYGVLYNIPGDLFDRVIGDSLVRVDTICPVGWHIPTESEWIKMEIFLENNGYNFDGYIDNDDLRETHNVIAKSLAYISDWTVCNERNTIGWLQNKNNKSHFGAMPGGWANVQTGVYAGLHDFGSWWTKTDDDMYFDENNNFVLLRLYRRLDFDSSSILSESVNRWKSAMSIRCIRDY